MKSLSVILISLAVFIGCATATLQEKTNENIIDFPGLKKEQIFSKSMMWISTSFTSSKAVIDYQDKNEGKIIGNFTAEYVEVIITRTMKSKLIIDVKDNKAKLTFIPLMTTFNNIDREIYPGDLDFFKPVYSRLLESYKSSIQAKVDLNW